MKHPTVPKNWHDIYLFALNNGFDLDEYFKPWATDPETEEGMEELNALRLWPDRPPHCRRIACYATPGKSEGYYVYVDALVERPEPNGEITSRTMFRGKYWDMRRALEVACALACYIYGVEATFNSNGTWRDLFQTHRFSPTLQREEQTLQGATCEICGVPLDLTETGLKGQLSSNVGRCPRCYVTMEMLRSRHDDTL